ncbi:(2Fe-2S)-binding protein [Streptomyces sp.]|uniref:(2Fe-2S)-binding protein n=1 Tax=Streptomyces sp. TaxID=1931 RepID=UPI0028125388|nr:(2Fe-2S)-binding protein [Streptomyces sp.]
MRISVTVDGERLDAVTGQTVAGLLMSRGRVSWRTTAGAGRPRGLFCGIGVCFDCLVTVNGLDDVRACQRRVADGDVVETGAVDDRR